MSVTGEADGRAAEGRRGGRRPRLRAARRDRDPGRAGRARAHRRGPPRRGLAARLGADLAAQPGLGLGVGGRRAARAAATATRASRPTRPTRRPTARSPSRSATTACSRACARRSGCRAAGRRALRAPTRRGSRTSTRSPSALEAVFAHAARPTHWVEVLRAANVPVGPINDVAEAYALAESLGLEPILEADGVPLPPAGGSCAAPRRRARDDRGPPPGSDDELARRSDRLPVGRRASTDRTGRRRTDLPRR